MKNEVTVIQTYGDKRKVISQESMIFIEDYLEFFESVLRFHGFSFKGDLVIYHEDNNNNKD